MRPMAIQVFTGSSGRKQMLAAIKKNWKHYLQEALGLAIFMVSATFFSAAIYSKHGILNDIPVNLQSLVMGVLMGLTALFIFYSRWTAPSGSHINPAVTITFWRLGKMCKYDTLFFVLFQFAGGLIAVVVMQLLLGEALINEPVNSAATVPGKFGAGWALVTEFVISVITMLVVLLTPEHRSLTSYTRIFSSTLVCSWVIIAGPISGFGMNPARSFASALPSGIFSSFWIYLFIPLIGMLTAAEIFLWTQRRWRTVAPVATPINTAFELSKNR